MSSQKSGSGSRQIRDVMTANPECVTEKNTVRDAARIMKDQDTGVVPVVDGKKVIGLITDRDMVVRGIAEGKNLENASVTELMTKNVRSVREDATIDEVLAVMSKEEIRRLPVVNAQDELIGIVALGDISRGNVDGKVGQTMEKISEAPPNN
jgi:CBS domain-containing protein